MFFSISMNKDIILKLAIGYNRVLTVPGRIWSTYFEFRFAWLVIYHRQQHLELILPKFSTQSNMKRIKETEN